MRAKPSTTALGMNTDSNPFLTTIPIYAVSNLPGSHASRAETFARADNRPLLLRPEGLRDEGLLHDARNLMGAIGLYCDLLSMPGVLQPEHRQYADELRLLGARSGALIERLLQSSLNHPDSRSATADGEAEPSPCGTPIQTSRDRCGVETLREVETTGNIETQGNIDPPKDGASTSVSGLAPDVISSTLPPPVSLRSIVERCAGLLSCVAGGRIIELSFGEAASVPVSVDEEAIERILVNLVRNAATALRATERSGNYESESIAADCDAAYSNLPGSLNTVLHRTPDPTADETPGAIRIGVGFVVNRASDSKPWTIRRVRLAVEDSGCGMPPQQLERILYGTRSPSRGSHGIGFRVVRELVASSGGDLRVISAPRIGTRVQIEWPVAKTTREDPVAEASASTEYVPQRMASESLAPALSMLRQQPDGLPAIRREMCSVASHKSVLASSDIALSGSPTDSRSAEGSKPVC